MGPRDDVRRESHVTFLRSRCDKTIQWVACDEGGWRGRRAPCDFSENHSRERAQWSISRSTAAAVVPIGVRVMVMVVRKPMCPGMLLMCTYGPTQPTVRFPTWFISWGVLY